MGINVQFKYLVLDRDSKSTAKEIRFLFVTLFSIPLQFFNTGCDPQIEKANQCKTLRYRDEKETTLRELRPVSFFYVLFNLVGLIFI